MSAILVAWLSKEVIAERLRKMMAEHMTPAVAGLLCRVAWLINREDVDAGQLAQAQALLNLADKERDHELASVGKEKDGARAT